MTRNAFLFGGLLVALALGFYFPTGEKTALIPGAFGIIFLICGGIGLRGEHARKHAMHVAAVVSLLGILTIGRAIPKIMAGDLGLAQIEMLIFSGLCLVFLVLCIKSFRDARKAREAAAK